MLCIVSHIINIMFDISLNCSYSFLIIPINTKHYTIENICHLLINLCLITFNNHLRIRKYQTDHTVELKKYAIKKYGLCFVSVI